MTTNWPWRDKFIKDLWEKARERYPLPPRRSIGDGTVEGIAQVAFVAGASYALPAPGTGCHCRGAVRNHGTESVEYVTEYNPACSEHSTHLYDPVAGAWVLRPGSEEQAAAVRLFEKIRDLTSDEREGREQMQRDMIVVLRALDLGGEGA